MAKTAKRRPYAPRRCLLRRDIGRRFQLVINWMPPDLYTRAELFYGRDAVTEDWAVTSTLGRLEVGWYARPRREGGHWWS